MKDLQGNRLQIANQIVASNHSTSEKIRMLASEGFLRVEIRDLLRIRYQHVRKVLLDSGMTGGLVNATESNRTVQSRKRLAMRVEPFDWNDLIESGFKLAGEWRQANGDLQITGDMPSEPGVYVFIVDDVIVYIGLTRRSLRQRIGHYKIGHQGQKTSARVKVLIGEALNNGKVVRILCCAPGSTTWNGLPVHIGPGLESALIERIQPAWNIQGQR